MRRLAPVLVALLVLPGCVSQDSGSSPDPDDPDATPATLAWGAPVGVGAADGGVGYEPSLAMDTAGALYYTAHKDLTRPDTWPYPASWFLVSRDNGSTWEAPAGAAGLPALQWQSFVGDEGDIATDARGWVYFLDTYLGDNHLHAWSDQGREWEYSIPAMRTTGADDRPWITAQGEGIVHYLGNNGVQVNGGRHWYYRSTDAGLTWTLGEAVPGGGWAHIAADRAGKHVYVAQESTTGEGAEMRVLVSADEGASWSEPVVIAERAGDGRMYPIVAVGGDGSVAVAWHDAGSAANAEDVGGGKEPTRLFVARSTDHGQSWTTADVTPASPPMFIDYYAVDVGPTGAVGVAFYATEDLPVGEASEWFLYGAVWSGEGEPAFAFTRADATPLATTGNLHDLHDFFEIVVGADGALNVAYQRNVAPGEADRRLYFVRGTLE